MLASDEHAKAMLEEHRIAMPEHNLMDSQIREYIAYFNWFDARPAAHR